MSGCTPSSEDIKALASIDRPVPNQLANVLAAMPGPTIGNLCFCNGQALPPQQFTPSAGVRALCRRPTEPAPTVEDMFSQAPAVWPQGSQYLWQAHGAVKAYCEDAPAANNNKLYVMATWIVAGQPIPDWAPVTEFKGKRVQNCMNPAGIETPGHETEANQEEALTAAPEGYVDCAPWNISGDYLEYRHLSVEQFYGGNRLLRHGRPLKARRIAVAAYDVAWQYDGSPPNTISRSVGDLATAPAGWLFMGLPQASIVIWQLDLERRRVVISECSDKPDIITLDPHKPIYVQVNFPWTSLAQRTGSFGLHVRVID